MVSISHMSPVSSYVPQLRTYVLLIYHYSSAVILSASTQRVGLCSTRCLRAGAWRLSVCMCVCLRVCVCVYREATPPEWSRKTATVSPPRRGAFHLPAHWRLHKPQIVCEITLLNKRAEAPGNDKLAESHPAALVHIQTHIKTSPTSSWLLLQLFITREEGWCLF